MSRSRHLPIVTTSPLPEPSAVSSNPHLCARGLRSLLLEIADGSSGALSALYRATAPCLHTISHTWLRSKHDSEEIVCDVFLYVWFNSHQYNEFRGSVITWLMMLTRSRSIDRLRKCRSISSKQDIHSMTTLADLDGAVPAADQLVATMEDHRHLYRLLAGLSRIRRELISLAFLKGLCHEEIADAMELPLGTVKSHIRRGLHLMREEFSQSQLTAKFSHALTAEPFR